MKRDVIIAIAVGFALGSIVALSLVYLPSLVKDRITSTEKPLVTSTPTPTIAKIETSQPTLEIDKPEDESVSDNKTLTVSGRTQRANFIIVESEADAKIAEVDTSGNFSATITLSEGANNLYISAYDSFGQRITKLIIVYYTSEKL